EYPEDFRTLPALGGYVFHDGDPIHERGYFVTTERRRYDVHVQDGGRGLLLETLNPLGNATKIGSYKYSLLPETVTDAAGLTTTAAYDDRVLQPRELVDPNGNRTAITFTPLGLVASMAVVDKAGMGDSPEVPGTQFVYDFLAFENSPPDERQPISVRT